MPITFRLILGYLRESNFYISLFVPAPSWSITNSKAAKLGQFPYHATLVDDSYYHEYFCGGVIINRRWIVTPAQCVFGKALARVEVMIGEIWLAPIWERWYAVDIRIHPDYNNETKANDVAVVKVDIDFEFSNYAEPLKIIERKVSPAENLTFSGWGGEQMGFPYASDDLRFLDDLVSVSSGECQRQVNVNGDSICVESTTGVGCGKEQGSILAVPGVGVVGLYSYGATDCQLNTPNVFVNLSQHRQWILNQTALV